jgi:hypothetical protein
MHGRYNRLLFLVLSAFVVSSFWGCSQPDNIVAPASTTKFVLSPERLPSPPEGMVYELWVKNDDGQPISLGKFDWNDELYRFYDTAGNRIDSIWTVGFDALKYKYLCISVENYPDPDPASMGPIMLQDTIVDPSKKPIKMLFPVDLWLGVARYCVQSPTDAERLEKDGSGIWFGLYTSDTLWIYDTTYSYIQYDIYNENQFKKRPIDTLGFDTNFDPPRPIYDSAVLDALSHLLDTIASTNARQVIDSHYVISMDTFVHIGSVFDYVTVPVNVSYDTIYDTLPIMRRNGTEVDSVIAVPPLIDYEHTAWTIYTIVSHKITVERFLPDYQDLPNMSEAGPGGVDLGWHYKGWVLSPYLEPQSAFASLTKPCWGKTVIENWLDPSDGGIITTGSFKSFEAPDDGNPYSMNKRVPSIPGEDFLISLPMGVNEISFASETDREAEAGTVVITLEPDNYNNPSANFPLVLFVSSHRIPSYDFISDTSSVQEMTLPMLNLYRAVDDDIIGFPAIHVTLIRE